MRIEASRRGFFRRRPEGDKPVGRQSSCFRQGFLRPRHCQVGSIGICRQEEPADGQHRPNRASLCVDHAFSRYAQKALGCLFKILFIAICQNNSELCSRETPYGVAAANHLPQPAADRYDDFIGDIESIGIVDHAEIGDCRDQKGATVPLPLRGGDAFGKSFRHASPVHHAGQGIAVAEES